MELQQITQRLLDGNIQGHEAVEMRTFIAGWYSFYSHQLQEILVRKPQTWNAKRPEFKSDKACDQWWNATDNGINEMGLAMSMKRCEKILSVLKSIVDSANTEFRHSQ